MRIARRFTCRYKAVSSTHFPDLSLKSTLSRDERIKTRPIWMPFDPERPYNDLPSLPPSQDVETKTVLKACIEARAVLAELRISGRLIPNTAVLINSIPLLEAQASSEIENIVTTADRLFRFANDAGNHADAATKRQSASVYLKALMKLGVLAEIRAGRENLYTNPALLRLLSEQNSPRPRLK